MKKKLMAGLLALSMMAVMAGTGFAEEVDYDVENREYDGVTITLHTSLKVVQ